jgi:hypothetical protein
MVATVLLLTDQVMEDKIVVSIGNLLALLGVDEVTVMLDELLVRNDNLGICPPKLFIVFLSIRLTVEILFLDSIVLPFIVVPVNNPFIEFEFMGSISSLLALFGVDGVTVMLDKLFVRNDDLGISETKVFVEVLSLLFCREITRFLDTIVASLVVMPVDSPFLVCLKVEFMSSVSSLLALLGMNLVSVVLDELLVRNDDLGISETEIFVEVFSLFLRVEVL